MNSRRLKGWYAHMDPGWWRETTLIIIIITCLAVSLVNISLPLLEAWGRQVTDSELVHMIVAFSDGCWVTWVVDCCTLSMRHHPSGGGHGNQWQTGNGMASMTQSDKHYGIGIFRVRDMGKVKGQEHDAWCMIMVSKVWWWYETEVPSLKYHKIRYPLNLAWNRLTGLTPSSTRRLYDRVE